MHDCITQQLLTFVPLPRAQWSVVCVGGEGVGGEEVDVCELLRRVQEHVLVNRIRVSEHFQDFDH